VPGALIREQEIVKLFNGAIPSPLIIVDKLQVHGAAVGWTNGIYAIVPLIFDDVPENSVETSRTIQLIDNVVQINRTWETRPLLIPDMCTRTEGLLALLAYGINDPENDILAAIENIADPVQKTIAKIKFKGNTWERADPYISLIGAALNLTEDDIDALFVSTQKIEEQNLLLSVTKFSSQSVLKSASTSAAAIDIKIPPWQRKKI
jgi:hypothetical protein